MSGYCANSGELYLLFSSVNDSTAFVYDKALLLGHGPCSGPPSAGGHGAGQSVLRSLDHRSGCIVPPSSAMRMANAMQGLRANARNTIDSENLTKYFVNDK